MQLLDTLTVYHEEVPRRIELYQGDLTNLTPEDAVDVLVISSIPGSYTPSRGTLIRALYDKGIIVKDLAQDKALDFRNNFNCWVSRKISSDNPGIQFQRILCFEPDRYGKAPELVGGIFQCLVALLGESSAIKSVAMPLVATGAQRTPVEEVFSAMMEASVQWLRHGLELETIKIVAYSNHDVKEIKKALPAIKKKYASLPPEKKEEEKEGTFQYDVFISYAHQNSREVQLLIEELQKLRPNLRIFLDRKELNVGSAWQEEIFKALDSCRKIVPIYSPAYLTSKACKEEFNIGLYRDRDSDGYILFPLYLYSAELPTYMKVLQYIDCREGNEERVKQACRQLLSYIEGKAKKGREARIAQPKVKGDKELSKGRPADRPKEAAELARALREMEERLKEGFQRMEKLEEQMGRMVEMMEELLKRGK